MTTTDKQDIVEGLVSSLEAKGLMVVPASLVDDYETLKKAQNLLRSRSKLTPYEVAKFKLIPNATSYATVMNMVKDGRIKSNETYRDRSGKLYILRSGIERIKEAI